MNSINHYFKQNALTTFFSIVLLLSVIFSCFSFIEKIKLRKAVVAHLVDVGHEHVNYLVPSFLLEEQKNGANILITLVNKKEGKGFLDIISVEKFEDLVNKKKSCSYNNEYWVCGHIMDQNVTVILPIKIQEKVYSYLKIKKNVVANDRFFNNYVYFIVVFFICLIAFMAWIILNSSMSNVMIELNKLSDVIEKLLSGNNANEEISKFRYREFRYIVLTIEKLIKNNNILKSKILKQKISEEVAHDIRSPLAAINIMLEIVEISDIEAKKVLISAVNRINDIANNLLNESRDNNEILCVDVIKMLNDLIAEKKYEIKNTPRIKILMEGDVVNDDFFCDVNPAQFQRVVSNIINNSIEAITHDGFVKIEIINDVESILFKISDNGIGISPDKLDLIFEPGRSFNKTNGNGLGLAHAKENILQWSGTITIESVVAKGTVITISLPRSGQLLNSQIKTEAQDFVH